MYQTGDIVVYGGEGVCTVDKIDSLDISGISKDKKYYYLTPLYRGGTIYTPVDTTVFMRYLISKEEAQELIEQIPDIEADVFTSTNIRLISEHYQSIIKSYKCQDLVKVIKAIYNKRTLAFEKGKRLGSVDERFLTKCENILFGELTVALGIDKEQVEQLVKEKINS